MAVVHLSKVRLVFPLAETEAVLDGLMDYAHAEIIPAEASNSRFEEHARRREYELNTTTFAIGFLRPYHEATLSFWKKILPQDPRIITKAEAAALLADDGLRADVERAVELDRELLSAREEIAKLSKEISVLQDWKDLPFVPGIMKEKFAQVKIGTIADATYETFVETIKKHTELTEVTAINKIGGRTFFYVLFHESQDSFVTKQFANFKAETVELLTNEKLPRETLEGFVAERAHFSERVREIEIEAAHLAARYDEIIALADALLWEWEKWRGARDVAESSFTAHIELWAPKDGLEAMKKTLAGNVQASVLAEIDRDEDEVPPVLLKNKSVGDVEMVTKMYGLPAYHEPDPTPWLTPFFILFFGFCLTDAGYGIVLLLLGLAARAFLPLSKGIKQLVNILIIGGISTIVLGAAFGGWFGYTPDQIPGALGETLNKVWFIDALKKPIDVLYMTFALGLLQILTGIVVSMWWKMKQGNVVAGLLDNGSWLVFLLALVSYALNAAGVFPGNWQTYALYGATAFLIVAQGRGSKNIVGKFFTGTMSLYNVIGYFSDMLSYSRLLALGLATGIIAAVINLLGHIAYDMAPGALGWAIAFVVLVVGHTFNILINVLGAYIHSARLQYVEFFPKFMDGGGRPFRHFMRVGKYGVYSPQ